MWKDSNLNWIFSGHVACFVWILAEFQIFNLKECNYRKILGENTNYSNYQF